MNNTKEIEEIMDEESIAPIATIINNLKEHLRVSNVLSDMQNCIKDNYADSTFLSIGINRRNMESRGKLCIALLESGGGSLLSIEYREEGIRYIHSLDVDVKAITTRELSEIIEELNTVILNYLHDNNIIRAHASMTDGIGHLGTRLYTQR